MWAALTLPLVIVSLGASVALMVHGFPTLFKITKHYHLPQNQRSEKRGEH